MSVDGVEMSEPRSVSDLIAAIESQVDFKYLYFWGHTPDHRRRVGRACLSQWWSSRFSVDGTEFATAEHYMMWRKAMLFGNQALAREILTVEHPGHAKSLGRQVENFDEEEWNEARYQIVVTGNVAKFGQNPDLKKFLLVTGSRVLVEASPVDRIWGIGVAADDPRAQDPGQWRGSNLLGFALMDARTELSELG